MVINDPLVICNVLVCAAIVVRLMFFRKPGARYQWWAAWLAWLMVIAYASVPFRFLFGLYGHAHWASLVVNTILCAAVFRAGGNMAHVFQVLKPGKETGKGERNRRR